MQSVLLYPRRSRFAPNLLKNNLSCILTPGPANVNKGGFVKKPDICVTLHPSSLRSTLSTLPTALILGMEHECSPCG